LSGFLNVLSLIYIPDVGGGSEFHAAGLA